MRRGWLLATAGVATLWACFGVLARTQTAVTAGQKLRAVYVTVTDDHEAPVTDLTGADLRVTEAGRERQIVSVKPAAGALRVALIVADGWSGVFHLASAHFVQELYGTAAFGIYRVIVQPEKLVNYSADARVLRPAIDLLGARRGGAGGDGAAQVLEAIVQAAGEVRGEADRAAIVVLKYGGDEAGPTLSQPIRDQIRRQGITLYAVSIVTPQSGVNAPAIDAGPSQGDSWHLALVLGDGSADSGGRHERVVSGTVANRVKQIARELKHQYEVMYEVPAGARAGEKMSVTTTRRNVKVWAPKRTPGV
jgi:hypothetical protein